jgi:hypothetical protein
MCLLSFDSVTHQFSIHSSHYSDFAVLIDNFVSVGGSAAKDAKGSSTEQPKAHPSKLSKHKESYYAIATRIGSPA